MQTNQLGSIVSPTSISRFANAGANDHTLDCQRLEIARSLANWLIDVGETTGCREHVCPFNSLVIALVISDPRTDGKDHQSF